MAFFDDQEIASVVAALGAADGKHSRDDHDVAGGFVRPAKVARYEPIAFAAEPEAAITEPSAASSTALLRPAPFFYYKDFSTEADPDPLKPLTPPGTVPNFVAKMHAILSRPDLADVIAWMPHGRAWRVLKPREFEIRVIPTYFEHAKFSSFIRQANGWGFRRITQGPDRNAYYHELFLRGLPHLCKKMKRPGVSQKQACDPEHEPDLYKISEMFPLKDKAPDDCILLDCTVQGGPKARMPIYTGTSLSSYTTVAPAASMPMETSPTSTSSTGGQLTPMDLAALASFQKAMAASENQVQNVEMAPAPVQAPVAMPQPAFFPAPAAATAPLPAAADSNNLSSALATADRLAFYSAPNLAALQQASSAAASQFAAGFVAATALSHQQFRNLLGQAFAAGVASQGAPAPMSNNNVAAAPPSNKNNNMAFFQAS